MSVYGCFARADHPVGWGATSGLAHGYVVLFVGPCKDVDELTHIRKRLEWTAFYGLNDSGQYGDGNLHEWFGGRFDYIAAVDDPELDRGDRGRFVCRGDNRFVGTFTPDEVLAGG